MLVIGIYYLYHYMLHLLLSQCFFEPVIQLTTNLQPAYLLSPLLFPPTHYKYVVEPFIARLCHPIILAPTMCWLSMNFSLIY